MTTPYEDRLVAFIDILGFKDLIARSCGPNPEVGFDDIREMLKPPAPAGRDQIVLGRIGDVSNSGHRISAFSDSIAISTDASEAGFIHLLTHVEKISYSLFGMKALCRGAVAQGGLYHDRDTVFGPALIRAVELERLARFPRIILDAGVVETGRALAEPLSKVFDRLVRVCDDGHMMVHTLRRFRVVADAEAEPPQAWRELIRAHRSFLRTEIERLCSDPDQRKKEKVEWFLHYFESACDRSGWEILKNTRLPRQTLGDLGLP